MDIALGQGHILLRLKVKLGGIGVTPAVKRQGRARQRSQRREW
jgi:hypothetical protein